MLNYFLLLHWKSGKVYYVRLERAEINGATSPIVQGKVVTRLTCLNKAQIKGINWSSYNQFISNQLNYCLSI